MQKLSTQLKAARSLMGEGSGALKGDFRVRVAGTGVWKKSFVPHSEVFQEDYVSEFTQEEERLADRSW